MLFWFVAWAAAFIEPLILGRENSKEPSGLCIFLLVAGVIAGILFLLMGDSILEAIDQRLNQKMIPTTGQILNVDIARWRLWATVRYETKDGQVIEARGRALLDDLCILQFIPGGRYQILYLSEKPRRFAIDPQQFDSEPQIDASALRNEEKGAIKAYVRFLRARQINISEEQLTDMITGGNLANIGRQALSSWQGGFAGETTVQQPSIPHPPVQQFQFPPPAVQRPPAEEKKEQASNKNRPQKDNQDAPRILDI